MPGFFGYLFLATVFTLGGIVHFLILLFRNRQPVCRYAAPEFGSWLCTYLFNQALFTALTLDSTVSLVLPVYLAMPFATLGWWWLVIRQFRSAKSFSRYVSCVLPVFYVPFLFLMPMLGGAMGNWPYGTLPRGLPDDFAFVWVVGYPTLHVLSIIFVVVTWASSTASEVADSADPNTVDHPISQSDNPYSPPATL